MSNQEGEEEDNLPDSEAEVLLDLLPFLKPEVPPSHPPHQSQNLGDGWTAIDGLSPWECYLSKVPPMEEVPRQYKHIYGWAFGVIIERNLDASKT